MSDSNYRKVERWITRCALGLLFAGAILLALGAGGAHSDPLHAAAKSSPLFLFLTSAGFNPLVNLGLLALAASLLLFLFCWIVTTIVKWRRSK